VRGPDTAGTRHCGREAQAGEPNRRRPLLGWAVAVARTLATAVTLATLATTADAADAMAAAHAQHVVAAAVRTSAPCQTLRTPPHLCMLLAHVPAALVCCCGRW
jgi:tetrahydromethanopterin S-methyltransferase subunit E